MPIESFISEPDCSQQEYHLFDSDEGAQGHLYASYPNGRTGVFEAIIVRCTGRNTAHVIELVDGSRVQSGMKITELSPYTGKVAITGVDQEHSFERAVISPE